MVARDIERQGHRHIERRHGRGFRFSQPIDQLTQLGIGTTIPNRVRPIPPTKRIRVCLPRFRTFRLFDNLIRPDPVGQPPDATVFGKITGKIFRKDRMN